jgi:hypothetical protein
MYAKLHKNKIIILGLYPFALVLSKNSKYVRKITETSVFIESLVARDIVIPVPIAK